MNASSQAASYDAELRAADTAVHLQDSIDEPLANVGEALLDAEIVVDEASASADINPAQTPPRMPQIRQTIADSGVASILRRVVTQRNVSFISYGLGPVRPRFCWKTGRGTDDYLRVLFNGTGGSGAPFSRRRAEAIIESADPDSEVRAMSWQGVLNRLRRVHNRRIART
ncbi:hypothetical protein GPALN_015056 [Globodera pallida]|nr:hypothetical protein GPALN_015056 [Globodera pallida]